MTVEAWLLAHIEYDTAGRGCWLWSGQMLVVGYGAASFEGRMQYAHRLAWTLWRGPIPPDTPHVCHHCDTPLCIRPDHLFLGTQADNIIDMARKGRGTGVLTPDNVRTIRARLAAGERHRAIAIDFGVSRTTISDLGRGETYCWVT